MKGDPYVIDVRRNKGHVGSLTSGCWHPKIKDEFLTASSDASLRYIYIQIYASEISTHHLGNLVPSGMSFNICVILLQTMDY